MTDDQLTAMAELAEKATLPPWTATAGIRPSVRSEVCAIAPIIAMSVDAAFIAAARQFVPDAIAEVKRLRELVEKAYAEGFGDFSELAPRDGYDWHNSDAKRALGLLS